MHGLRCLILVFTVALGLALLPGLPSARAAAPEAGTRGSISGRLHAGRAQASRLAFFIDGARVRPDLKAGRFLIHGVPSGEHAFSVVDRRGHAGSYRMVTVRPHSTTQLGAVALQHGGQITGLVSEITDITTGALTPLAGVEVIAESDGWKGGGPGGVVQDPPPPISLKTTTDETGAYAFQAVPVGAYRVSVVVPGLEAGVSFVYVQLGYTAVADFQLLPAIEEGVGTVMGTVTDSAAQPLEGALVNIYTNDGVYLPFKVSAASRAAAARAGRGAAAVPGALPHGVFSTLTDKDGRYTLNVPSGYLTFTVYADGYTNPTQQVVLQPRETQTIDVTLEVAPPEGATVYGYVIDNHTKHAIAHATVVIDNPKKDHGPLPGLTTTTDDYGYYEVDNVPAGSYFVTVSQSHYGTQSQPLDLSPGDGVEVDFSLKPLKAGAK